MENQPQPMPWGAWGELRPLPDEVRALLGQFLGLPAEAYTTYGVEYYQSIGYLKSGVQFADRITSVKKLSDSATREIFVHVQS